MLGAEVPDFQGRCGTCRVGGGGALIFSEKFKILKIAFFGS